MRGLDLSVLNDCREIIQSLELLPLVEVGPRQARIRCLGSGASRRGNGARRTQRGRSELRGTAVISAVLANEVAGE